MLIPMILNSLFFAFATGVMIILFSLAQELFDLILMGVIGIIEFLEGKR